MNRKICLPDDPYVDVLETHCSEYGLILTTPLEQGLEISSVPLRVIIGSSDKMLSVNM